MRKINFMNGKPSEDLLPTELFLKASQEVFSRPDAASKVLQYGDELGPSDFLKKLALFLSKEYQDVVSDLHLLITPGASLALQHCLSLLTRPGTKTKRVFFQDPTYFLVFQIFLNVGFTRDQFVAIPDTETGLDVDTLETYLSNETVHEDVYDSVLYCVPTFANPTGSILSEEKRKRLVGLAKKHNMLILCDDVYDILTYKGSVPKRLVAYDVGEKPVVISNCSFSKLLAPGARVGWIETHPSLVKKLGTDGSFLSGGNPASLSSQLVSAMMTDDTLFKHIHRLKQVYADRLYHGLIEPIQRELEPLGCKLEVIPRGGYFVWLQLPIRTDQLLKSIETNNIDVGVGPGHLFRVHHQDENHIRLSLAPYKTDILKLGILRLKQAIELVIL